jgi:hypothetical protein
LTTFCLATHTTKIWLEDLISFLFISHVNHT